MIRHHPSETTLLAFASGALPALHARVVAIHIASCARCADDIELLEAAGGALLDRLPPAPLAPDALERIVVRLDGEPPAAPTPAVTAWTIEALATLRWRWSGPGVHMMPLARRDVSDTRLDLIRVAPGTALLEHGHTGFETTVVLQGALGVGHERYETGDFSEADGTLDHRPRALAGQACICLIATSGHLTARGLLGRLVRPLLGM
jgi:putative transcriptional regulator